MLLIKAAVGEGTGVGTSSVVEAGTGGWAADTGTGVGQVRGAGTGVRKSEDVGSYRCRAGVTAGAGGNADAGGDSVTAVQVPMWV